MDDDRYDNRPRSRDSRDSRDRDSRDSRDSRDRDYYPRRGGRGYRGRGGGRNYYNKRDNYYNDPYEHDDRSEKRRKYDPVDESEKKLKSLIVRVGDHSASDTLSSQLEALANELDSDMSKYKQVILDTLSQSILALPSKTSVYGTLVGLLNLKNFEVGKEVVLKVSATIQDCLDKHKFNELKLLFRFVGELVNSNVVLPSGILDVFNQCLTTLHDETNPKKSDYFAFLVMQTLPWVGRELNQRKADDLSKIMGQLQYYIQRRQKPNPILCVFEVDSNEDILNVLWSQLEKLREEGWSVTSILKPYTSFEKLNSSLQHTLPSIKVPLYNYETQFPTIRTKFRLFDSSDTESEIRPIDRFVIEDTIIDILKLWSSSHKDATTHIQSLPLSTDIDYLAIETIFGELFALPNPSHKPVYYGVVLMDYLKSKPTVAPVLGLAIATLFDRLSEMDVECVDRFTSWFSHHLSNFDYKWDWPAWDNVLTEKNEGIQLYCVKEILEKCLRLSYHERIKKTLPEEFHKLLPEPIIASMKYDLPENNSDKDYNSKINVLIDKFKNKLRSEEIQHGYLETEEFMEFTRDDKLEIIIYSILKSGSKSFSHFLATVERYLSLINAYITTSEDKIHVIKTVREFWFRSPQNIIIQIDKLMTYRVIDNIAIINWLFSQDELPNLTKGYMWEILYNTINKTLARTETIREELQDAEADLQKVPPESQTDDHPEVRRVKLRRETHDSALRESKELFLIIFQHFCLSLTEHLTQSEANGTDPNTFWFHITLGHLKATGRRYFKEISPFLTTLETLLFMNADQRLQNVFQLIKSI